MKVLIVDVCPFLAMMVFGLFIMVFILGTVKFFLVPIWEILRGEGSLKTKWRSIRVL